MTSFPRTVQRFNSATSNMITKKFPGDLQLEHIKDILQGDKAVSTIWVNGQCAISQHYISIEALDNPAIYALVEYKWNTNVSRIVLLLLQSDTASEFY
ncbi:hypothetical protein BGZ67_009913 [Mortierella alpina]|nr:hypothetical protein BGZ67_009913 [Mortierella alpina]